jgi:diaminohydroxyphosphoribosylaminopyrimidine deaminase/5-amino-6-(5-phosphoribosylamino)uracil reductase
MNGHDPVPRAAHLNHMLRALELARRGWGRTHPNPMVGSALVEGPEIVAEGWHRAAGEPHAEVEALRALGRKPAGGAILYVTLEPCSTEGRTGPCTRAIIESGIRRVVVGARDPNPRHAGRGLDILRQAGVEVTEGVLAEDCADLNLVFNHWIVTGRTFLAAKLALTLDGKFAAASGHARWVTGPEARADVMRWRRLFPAVACGPGTVLADDPALTSRIEGEPVWCPRRFVLDRLLRTAAQARLPQVYTDAFAARTTAVCGPEAGPQARERIRAAGCDLWELEAHEGPAFLQAFADRCAGAAIPGVYLEPGPRLATALVEAEALNYLFVYQAPMLLADSASPGLGLPRETTTMDQAHRLQFVRHAVLGDDVLSRGFLPPLPESR